MRLTCSTALAHLHTTMKYTCPYPQCKSRLVVATKTPVELLVRASAASQDAQRVQKAALNFINAKDVATDSATDNKAITEKDVASDAAEAASAPSSSDSPEAISFLPFYDPFDFDNISVTKPVFTEGAEPVLVSSDGKTSVSIERLLACAECDRGPYGVIGRVSNTGEGGLTHDKNVYLLRPESVVAVEQ